MHQTKQTTIFYSLFSFEMMSLVLALSGSAVGRSHLASQYNFIKDLMSLLHTASGRIQR